MFLFNLFRVCGWLYLALVTISWILIIARNLKDIRDSAIYAIQDLADESFGMPGEATLYYIVMIPVAIIMHLVVAFYRAFFQTPVMWKNIVRDSMRA
jgi:uncharacterized membrane protein YhaH (DUF805 family)